MTKDEVARSSGLRVVFALDGHEAVALDTVLGFVVPQLPPHLREDLVPVAERVSEVLHQWIRQGEIDGRHLIVSLSGREASAFSAFLAAYLVQLPAHLTLRLAPINVRLDAALKLWVDG